MATIYTAAIVRRSLLESKAFGSNLQAAGVEWFRGLSEDLQTAVAEDVIQVIDRMRGIKPDIQFGPSDAFEVLCAWVAVDKKWKNPSPGS